MTSRDELRALCEAHDQMMREAAIDVVKKEAPLANLVKTTTNVEPPPTPSRGLRWEDIDPDTLLDVIAEGVLTGPLAHRIAKLEQQVEALTALLEAKK